MTAGADGRALRTVVVAGTRPEGIKLAPVIRLLRDSEGFECTVVSTGQHTDMLDQVFDHFDLRADVALDLAAEGPALADLTAACIRGVDAVLDDERADVLIVQGDTASTFGAAVAGFLRGLPVVHLEAGLRTGDLCAPHPEEGNRRAISQLSDLHLAPTERCRENLVAEQIQRSSIVVVGNTAVDAVLWTASQLDERYPADPTPRLLVTAHRRESWGRGISDIGSAVAEVGRRYPAVEILVPAHPNPAVRDALVAATAHQPNVTVVPPLRYDELVEALVRTTVVLTDSGGLQEEAPALNVPVLVLRDKTERPEGVEAGCAALVGTDPATIVSRTSQLLEDAGARRRMADAPNPYGDGRAAGRVLDALRWRYRDGPPTQEFCYPESTADG